MNLEEYIAIKPNWPKKGVMFKDITPLLQDGKAYLYTVEQMAKLALEMGAELVVGPESRGFMFACPVATKLGVGFAPIRKKGKLPRETIEYSYCLVDDFRRSNKQFRINQRLDMPINRI